jgi:hypothetical protein
MGEENKNTIGRRKGEEKKGGKEEKRKIIKIKTKES